MRSGCEVGTRSTCCVAFRGGDGARRGCRGLAWHGLATGSFLNPVEYCCDLGQLISVIAPRQWCVLVHGSGACCFWGAWLALLGCGRELHLKLPDRFLPCWSRCYFTLTSNWLISTFHFLRFIAFFVSWASLALHELLLMSLDRSSGIDSIPTWHCLLGELERLSSIGFSTITSKWTHEELLPSYRIDHRMYR